MKDGYHLICRQATTTTKTIKGLISSRNVHHWLRFMPELSWWTEMLDKEMQADTRRSKSKSYLSRNKTEMLSWQQIFTHAWNRSKSQGGRRDMAQEPSILCWCVEKNRWNVSNKADQEVKTPGLKTDWEKSGWLTGNWWRRSKYLHRGTVLVGFWKYCLYYPMHKAWSPFINIKTELSICQTDCVIVIFVWFRLNLCGCTLKLS